MLDANGRVKTRKMQNGNDDDATHKKLKNPNFEQYKKLSEKKKEYDSMKLSLHMINVANISFQFRVQANENASSDIYLGEAQWKKGSLVVS